MSFLNFTGLIAGPIGQKFGVRPVVLLGTLIASCGLSSCFFTKSLRAITFLFGVVFGVGHGLIYTVLPVIINEYFLKLRSTASGIACSGASFGAIILSPLFEYLTESYGLSGCFLITGGIVLHVAIAGILMRPPHWLQNFESASNFECKNTCSFVELPENISYSKCVTNRNDAVIHPKKINYQLKPFGDTAEDDIKRNSEYTNNFSSACNEMNCLECVNNVQYRTVTKANELPSDRNAKNEMSLIEAKNVTNCCKTDKLNKSLKTGVYISAKSLQKSLDNTRECKETFSKIGILHNSNQKINTSINKETICDEIFLYEKKPGLSLTNTANSADGTSETEFTYKNFISNDNLNSSKSLVGILRSFKKVITCPMFYIITVNNIGFFLVYHIYTVAIVDFSMDREILQKDTKYVIFAFAIFDLAGRLCFGWITDRKILRRSQFLMVCTILMGIIFFIFPSVSGFTWITVVCCLYGLLVGSTMGVFPIILVDFLGMEVQAIATGSQNFLNGIASLCRPFMIGYFRDNLGTYSNMFYALGVISLIISFLWLLEYYLVKTDKTNTEEVLKATRKT